MNIERLARHARLQMHVEVGHIDFEDSVHLTEIERQASMRRRNMAFERRARAKGNNGQTIPRAYADDFDDFFC